MRGNGEKGEIVASFAISEPTEEKIKILTMIFLVSFSLLLISIFQTQLEEYTFYVHFFYLPIVLATFWWGKRGSVVSVFLGIFLVLTAIFSQEPEKEIFSSGVQAILFVIVALSVGILSDEKSDALKKEMQFKLDTAHYFFNPICVAKGFLSFEKETGYSENIEKAMHAIERIEKVIMNIVKKGEIHD